MKSKPEEKIFSAIQIYFENEFPSDLQKINFQQPNSVLQGILRTGDTPFFGGEDWMYCRENLSSVPAKNRNYFILSIFMIVLTDQCLFSCHRNVYEQWRERTHFPKFGWVGFGIHNENPFKLLWIPEREKIVDIDDMELVMPEFVDFFKYKICTYLPEINVSPNLFFENIRRDPAYQFDEGVVLKTFKSEFEKNVLNT